MNSKMPIRTIFVESIILCREHMVNILRLSWPYALLLTTSSLIENYVDLGIAIFNWLSWVVYLLALLIGVKTAVGCHSIFLIESYDVKKAKIFRWRKPEKSYLINGLVLMVFGCIILFCAVVIFSEIIAEFAPAQSKNYELVLVLFIPFYYLLSRFMLAFPDSAVGKFRNLTWAWKVSATHHLRLFFLLSVMPLFAILVFTVAAPGDISPWMMVTRDLLYLPISVIELCILSLSYKWVLEQSLEEGESLRVNK